MAAELCIYADVLFLVNFIVNYILLFTTGKLMRLKTRYYRLLIGACVGAIYAVFMFFPNIAFMYTVAAKLVFSLALVAVTYNISGALLYIRTLLTFYFITFSFGGGVMALFYFTNAGQVLGAVISNGVLYFNLPTGILVIFVLFSAALSFAVWRMYRVRLTNVYMPIKIVHNNIQSVAVALMDTGNALYDPLTNSPVAVLEYEKVRDMLPENVARLFEKKDDNEINGITEIIDEIGREFRFRFIPYSSLGKKNGMLLGFLPDYFYVLENESETRIPDIIVGIYNNKLASDGKYSALLHPEILV